MPGPDTRSCSIAVTSISIPSTRVSECADSANAGRSTAAAKRIPSAQSSFPRDGRLRTVAGERHLGTRKGVQQAERWFAPQSAGRAPGPTDASRTSPLRSYDLRCAGAFKGSGGCAHSPVEEVMDVGVTGRFRSSQPDDHATGQRISSSARRTRSGGSPVPSGVEARPAPDAARPIAARVVTSQCSGTANSVAMPSRSNALNWRTCSPSACAWIDVCASAWPRS